MKAYVGQTRSKRLIEELAAHGLGECTNRGETPPRRTPWFLDNGAFSDWRNERAFDGVAFWSDLTWAAAASSKPDFVVVPDQVATGRKSLAFSLRWFGACAYAYPGLRYYLAVQDGVTERDVALALASTPRRLCGIFVGGTVEWKLATGAAWVAFAHERGLPCHVGRVGTAKRVRWCISIGADSIDSCVPLFSRDNMRVFVEALGLTVPAG